MDESDEQDGTPLHYAAKKGFVGLAKVLVGAGANVDARNVKNMAPLHLVRAPRRPWEACRCQIGTIQ